MLNCLVADFFGLDESSTLTVKVDVPVVVGLPEIVPALLRVRPDGRLPADTDQTCGAVPPEADNDWE